ncbi:MAG: hypothetical protein ACRECJ_06365, partial [Limisphaerales bacterium]
MSSPKKLPRGLARGRPHGLGDASFEGPPGEFSIIRHEAGKIDSRQKNFALKTKKTKGRPGGAG